MQTTSGSNEQGLPDDDYLIEKRKIECIYIYIYNSTGNSEFFKLVTIKIRVIER